MYGQPFVGYGHLDCFQFGALMNNADLSIHAQLFMWSTVFLSLG